VNVAGVANVSVKFFYLGSLIANPPIVAGTTLAPTVTGEIVYRFTQPAQACDSKTCEQEILQIDKNPESCWSTRMSHSTISNNLQSSFPAGRDGRHGEAALARQRQRLRV